MINIYEGALKLINPKLYNSPYRGNVIQVLNILKNFKFKCRLIYLNNLRKLVIEKVKLEQIQEDDLFSGAVYIPDENKIYVPGEDEEMISESINHELFHTSSTRKNSDSGVVWNNNGWRYTEGITEYLNLKSRNKKVSVSGYQLELFVIEFLIFIYGEEILEPYFENNGKKFFNQFGNNIDKILIIDSYLEASSEIDDIHLYRLHYLCLTDRMPNILKDDIEFLKRLSLDNKTLDLIRFHVNANSEKITENYNTYGYIDLNNYKFNDLNKELIYEEFSIDYQITQTGFFKEILKTLISLAEEKNISLEEINNFIKESFEYKSEHFKNTYTDSINEIFSNNMKKR